MSRKIAIIGAGGQKFVRQSVIDLLQFEELRDVRLALMDINPQRLERAERVVRLIAAELKAPVSIEATTDQRRAVDGADYVLLTFMVGGMKHYQSDTSIPETYGISVASGDTIGPGAVMRLLRSAPLLKALAKNLAETAPRALVLNYANPLAMMVGMLIAYGHSRAIGLCHSALNATTAVSTWLGLPREEIEYTIGGLNHINFLLRLAHKGRDLYPDLLANADRIVREAETWEAETGRKERFGYERARMEVVKYLGYFPLEGPWHQGEYYPWFRKNAELVKHYGPATGWALRFDQKLAELAEKETGELLSGARKIDCKPGIELGAPIIHSLETGVERPVVISQSNRDGLIANLPPDAVVEVRGRVDAWGIHPDKVGRIPTQLAGIMHEHYTVQRLAIEGILAQDRVRLRQAIQADPLTSAVLTLPRIEEMVGELLHENRDYLADWP